ncbi:MAG: alkaline phosphatase D family protein [Cyclobacteriaceae bacterium]
MISNRLSTTIKTAFSIALCGLVCLQLTRCSAPTSTSGPYFATGVKIGEVDQQNALVWLRLTKSANRVGSEAPVPKALYQNPETGEWGPENNKRMDMPTKVEFPEGYDINTIEGAVPGASGEVKVRYRKAGGEWQETPWHKIDGENDFIKQVKLSNLTAGTSYDFEALARPPGSEATSATITGYFKTAPQPTDEKPISFVLTTCTGYPDLDSLDFGYKMYPQMLKLKPDFFVHTGDILYYDRLGKTKDLALWHWDRMYSLPSNLEFHRQVTSYFIKDDHDTWMNDSWPGRQTRFMGEFTFEQGLELFRNEVPMGDKTYRTFRWGKDVQIWMVEGRDFRSPNDTPDGPGKTIWGKEQKDWFKRTVSNSDATFKFLISPTPLVGPDRDRKNDNHANSGFQYEGREIREFISTQANMFVICGDRHWQYVSKDDDTGVLEFSCGAGSDDHAGGWKPDDLRPQHLYMNVIGGFLSVNVKRQDQQVEVVFRHLGVDGRLLNEHRALAENPSTRQLSFSQNMSKL